MPERAPTSQSERRQAPYGPFPCTYDLDENGEGCGAHPYCSKDCQLGDLHTFTGPRHMEDQGADTSDGMICEGCGVVMNFLPERRFPD